MATEGEWEDLPSSQESEPSSQVSEGGWEDLPARKGAEGWEDLPAREQGNISDLNLTPQEEGLYQRHLSNLNGPGGVDNPDGSRSTLYQMSFERDGKTYNVPTVWDGKILKPDDAIKRAEQEGLEKFPSYGSQEEAERRYDQMHSYMERDTQAFLAGRKGWEDLPPTEQKPAEEQSTLGSMLRGAAHAVLPTAAAIGAGSLVAGPVGGLVAALLAGGAAGYGQEKLLEQFWPEEHKRMQEAEEQHPFATGAGGALAFGPFASIGLGNAAGSTLLRKAAPNITNAVVGGGIDLAISGDPYHAAGTGLASGAFGNLTPLGERVAGAGARAGARIGTRSEESLSASTARGMGERENAANGSPDVDPVADEAAVRNASQGAEGDFASKDPTVQTANERVSPGDGPDSGPKRDNPGPQEYGKGKQAGEGDLEARPAGEIDEAVAAALKPKEPVVGSPEGTGEVPPGPKVEQTNFRPEGDRGAAAPIAETEAAAAEPRGQYQQQQQPKSTLLKGYDKMTADEQRAALGRAAAQQGEGAGGGKPPGGGEPPKVEPPNKPSVPEIKVDPADKSGLKGVIRDIQRIFAPQSLKGTGALRNLARETANSINKTHGRLENLFQSGMHSLDPHNELLHSMDGDRQRQLIDRAMGGDHFPNFVPTKQEERMLADYKTYYDRFKPILQALDPDQKFRENYLPGLYENEDAARDFYRRWKPGGDDNMTEAKHFATYEDARNAGLKPLTNDMYELAARYGMRVRDFATAEMFKREIKNNGLGKYMHNNVEPGWVPLRDTTGKETTLYAPENLAAVYNNFVDQGFRAQHPRLYDAVQHGLNAYTIAELGLNGYHFSTMAHEGITHDMSRASVQMAEGQFGKGASTLVKAPFAPLRTPLIGRKATEQFLDPNFKATWKDLMVDADVHPVGRGHSPESMAGARDSFIKLTSAENVKSQLNHAWKSVQKEFGEALNDKDVAKLAKASMQNAGRLIQTTSHALFDVYIPWMKMGAIHESVADFLSSAKGKSLDLTNRNGPDWKYAVEQIRRDYNSVDNRFGEAVMNHMFMNRALQQTGQLGLRAFGWAVNSIKEIGGGSLSAGMGIVNTARGKDGGILQRLQRGDHYDPRIAYLIGFPMALGFASTVTQMAFTGEPPQSFKDLGLPRTGGTVPGYGTKGETEERLVMPGYLKDVLGWVMHPFTEAYNKLNGLISRGYETARGQDSFGRTFLNPYDSPMDQMIDRLKYFGEHAAPISIQNLMKGSVEGSKIPQFMTALGFHSPSQQQQDPERAEAGEKKRLGNEFDRREKSLQRQEQAHGREYERRKAAPPPPPEEKRSTLVR